MTIGDVVIVILKIVFEQAEVSRPKTRITTTARKHLGKMLRVKQKAEEHDEPGDPNRFVKAKRTGPLGKRRYVLTAFTNLFISVECTIPHGYRFDRR